MAAATASAHDLEHTQVLLTFARDGSFIVDVANDPAWLKLRLEPFTGSFADRVVLWVDGKEIRPTSVEYLPASAEGALATHRLRGRMPIDARTLRWYYGLVIDPYPMTIRRADGRVIVEDVRGDAWSRANAPPAKDIPPLAPAGKNEFKLIGVSEFNLPAHRDHTVIIKGLFIKAAPTSRVNMTSIAMVAPTCAPGPAK